jgi:hypothetical protein
MSFFYLLFSFQFEKTGFDILEQIRKTEQIKFFEKIQKN